MILFAICAITGKHCRVALQRPTCVPYVRTWWHLPIVSFAFCVGLAFGYMSSHGDTAIAARVAGDEMNESRLAFDMMVFPLPPKLPMFIVLLSFLDLIYTSLSNPGKLCPPSNFDVWAEWYALREEWYVSAANLGIFLQQWKKGSLVVRLGITLEKFNIVPDFGMMLGSRALQLLSHYFLRAMWGCVSNLTCWILFDVDHLMCTSDEDPAACFSNMVFCITQSSWQLFGSRPIPTRKNPTKTLSTDNYCW